MDFFNYIGKDCRYLIYKKLTSGEKFPFLFVNKKYRKEISNFFHCYIHYDCFFLTRINCRFGEKPCFVIILPDLIKNNYFENLKTYYNHFQDDIVLFYIFYYSIFYEQYNIFKKFFILNVNKSNKIINRTILFMILEKESIEIIKFICNHSWNQMFKINIVSEINRLINLGYDISTTFKDEYEKFLILQDRIKLEFFIAFIVFFFVFILSSI